MTQPLNFATKALEAFLSYPCDNAPGAAAGFQYLADKLRQAESFVLPDGGQLFDRKKPRPHVPGLIFRPPFPVVALEYVQTRETDATDIYNQSKCRRRIALAWDWQDDLPPILRAINPQGLSPGVVVVSIPFYDNDAIWLPIACAVHIPYDDPWSDKPIESAFRDSMVASGRIAKERVGDEKLTGTPLLLNPEAVIGMVRQLGGFDAAMDMFNADNMDEVNAYADLCIALACKNVTTREHAAPLELNRHRIKAGKLPLRSFHVLELGDSVMTGTGGTGDRTGPRSHLRRGHIRRLSANRITWVNASVVRGRGLVEKVYSVGARRAAAA